MLQSKLDFPEKEGDSRKLKKVEELVQHFSGQCRNYVPKQNITYKHWWKLEKREEKKTAVCTNSKQTSTWGLTLCGV